MTERELAEAIQIIPDRLYWAALHTRPKNTTQSHYFSIDQDLVYEPFFADFGPLNLSMLYRYTKLLEGKLTDAAMQDKRIIHFCSHCPKKRANAAFLICAYQVVAYRTPAEVAYEPFRNLYPPFLPFRDATMGICSYQCTILDCLKGLEKGIEFRWFDWNHFHVESYEFFEKVENGDMNWIIPEKFLAFAGPCPMPTDSDGYPAFTPEDYVPIFREADISLIVRLNKQLYDRRRFIDRGIKHVDLYFLDGSCPSQDIISKFLLITENERGPVAVHCKAGLGRTGTLIGLYAMKHFHIPARAFIGWNRICRPGSILGPQQQFLVDMQTDMFQAGMALRKPVAPPSQGEAALAQRMERLTLRERSHAEQHEDVGQGDRLCNAKRIVRVSAVGGPTTTGGGLEAIGHAPPPMAAPLPSTAAGVGGMGAMASRPSLGSAGLPANGWVPPQQVTSRDSQQRQVVGMPTRSLRGIFCR